MARVTVEDCLEHVDNRFELVMLSTKRARQLATGGKEPLVQWENDKPTVVALREIAEGLMSYEFIANAEIVEDEPLFAARSKASPTRTSKPMPGRRSTARGHSHRQEFTLCRA